MLKDSTPKKRNYYRSHGNTSIATSNAFLVRYVNKEATNYPCEGPFTDRDDAIAASIEYLKKGICSWVVSYND